MAADETLGKERETGGCAAERIGSGRGARRNAPHRLSIASTKHVVLPLPLCACAMRSRYTPAWSGCRIIGSVAAWIALGWSNFISA